MHQEPFIISSKNFTFINVLFIHQLMHQ